MNKYHERRRVKIELSEIAYTQEKSPSDFRRTNFKAFKTRETLHNTETFSRVFPLPDDASGLLSLDCGGGNGGGGGGAGRMLANLGDELDL
jgi:hypothetical protein